MQLNQIFIKDKYYNRLAKKFGDREAESMVRIVFEDMVVTNKVLNEITLDFAMAKVLEGYPIQYITGISYFLNLKLSINEHVLIPRPETEELVIESLQAIKNIKSFKAIDIGTGSGCIPIAIKSKRPDCVIMAIDISEQALAVAVENAKNHDMDIRFLNIDFLDKRQWDQLPTGLDLVISNPPYIHFSEQEKMSDSTIKHEPEIALFAHDEEAMEFYHFIAKFGLIHLKSNGLIVVEINEFRAQKTMELFEAFGYTSAELLKDINGKNRILRCIKQ